MYPTPFQYLQRREFPAYPRPLRQVYPGESQGKKRMTIALGFRCTDGVVLAADSQYTEGIAKLNGQKIFPIASNGYYGLTIAGSGGVPSLKGIVREIKKRLKRDVGLNAASFADIQILIENSLCAYYPKHIDSAPKDKQDDLGVQLLIGIWISGAGTQLFETFRTTAFKVDHHRCIGVGSHLAEYLNDVFFPPGGRPSVRLAEPLAAYIVGRSKQYVEFCGGHTFVRALLDDGTDEMVWNQEIRESDKYFQEFFLDLGHIRGLLGDVPTPQNIDMAPFTEVLRNRLIEFRAKQQGHRQKQEEMRQSLRRPHK